MKVFLKQENISNDIKKTLRFASIYGISRTITKVAGRKRKLHLFKPRFIHKNQFIGIVGCGQFQFSTIAYYLTRGATSKLLFCYDVNHFNSKTLGTFYSIPKIITESDSIYNIGNTRLVYIASNHSSHTPYAIEFLKRNVDVYCEKPIAVNFEQYDKLVEAVSKSKGNFYAGYNRPYSPAIIKLKNLIKNKSKQGIFTLNFFVSAHQIPPDHWYRNPEEGTRICGNVGHWIDLMVHIYNWRNNIPLNYEVYVAYSNVNEPDDDISITIISEKKDLTTITITSRSEPFEGINETLNFQYSSVIAKIDDFRTMKIWDGSKYFHKKYWPKDVGHKRSVLQPFKNDNRVLKEVLISTEIMLNIAEMVKERKTYKSIKLDSR